MIRVLRFAVASLFVAMFTMLALAPRAEATEVCWQTRPLTWNNGALARTFTASQGDTAFLEFPTDVAWDAVPMASAAAQNVATMTFVVTGTEVANADTVRFTVQRGAGGIYAFTDYRNHTAGLTNTAVQAGSFGRVFYGYIQNSTILRTIEVHGPLNHARIKVQGDPNGALNSVKAYITYPRLCSSR